MTRPFALGLISLIFVSAAAAQRAAVSFPGVSAAQVKQLKTAKRSVPLPLPTWVPAGFKIETIDMKLGAKVPIEDRKLVIVYGRSIAGGKVQRFALEAGLEGIGDLPYDTTHRVNSALGRIEIAYEPKDLDGGGKKLKNFVMTHWFDVGRTAWHYIGGYGAEEDDSSVAMISLADTQDILRSLRRF